MRCNELKTASGGQQSRVGKAPSSDALPDRTSSSSTNGELSRFVASIATGLGEEQKQWEAIGIVANSAGSSHSTRQRGQICNIHMRCHRRWSVPTRPRSAATADSRIRGLSVVHPHNFASLASLASGSLHGERRTRPGGRCCKQLAAPVSNWRPPRQTQTSANFDSIPFPRRWELGTNGTIAGFLLPAAGRGRITQTCGPSSPQTFHLGRRAKRASKGG